MSIMTSRSEPLWWTVALSEEVTDKKPLAVDIGDQPVVLWRDKQGIARALEDRCPHRRAPLSLGCIRDNGWIQCGYHGWSYEGDTGRLKEIPNMKDDQRFPPIYKAQPFAVAECDGFVHVNLDPKAAAPAPADRTMPLSGTAHVALEQSHWLDALYDDPGLVIDIKGVEFTPYLMSELREENGLFVMERSCLWGKLHWPSYATADFPITLLSRTQPDTGETELVLRDDAFNPLLTARLAPIPAARGVTQIRWRGELSSSLKGLHARRLGHGTPFAVRERIDAAALRVLRPSVSLHGKKLRSELAASATVAVAA
jgi:nitrite reductase/ring-hydroxylating ferredoxin subunit